MGAIAGMVLGMALLGVALAWVMRLVVRSLDYRVSVVIAMVVLAVLAGFTNSDASRPYLLTAGLYLLAGIPAYFIVMLTRPRGRHRDPA